MRAVPVWVCLQTGASSAAPGRWRCESVQTHARRCSIVLLKQTATRPTGVFAEPRKTQSDTPQPSDHHEIYLGASGGYVDLERALRQPPTEVARWEGDLTDSSLSQTHITHKTSQGKILREKKKKKKVMPCESACFALAGATEAQGGAERRLGGRRWRRRRRPTPNSPRPFWRGRYRLQEPGGPRGAPGTGPRC